MSSIVTASTRRRVTAGIAIAALGVGAPAAVASTDAGGEIAHQAVGAGTGVDLRSADAQAAESEPAAPVVDLRSADARAAVSESAASAVDLRSPDAKASEQAAVTATATPASAASDTAVSDTGTSEWVYVGIIAAGLLLLGGAAASTVRYRHHHPHGGNLAAH